MIPKANSLLSSGMKDWGVKIGPGVTSVKVDDIVIPLYTPECRQCDFCLNPRNKSVPIDSRETQGEV